MRASSALTTRAASLASRQALERPDCGNRQAGREGQALGDAAGDAQAGKRTRPRPEGDAVELPDGQAGLLQQRIDHRQDQLGVALSGMLFARTHVAVEPERGGTPFRGSIEREEVQSLRPDAGRLLTSAFSASYRGVGSSVWRSIMAGRVCASQEPGGAPEAISSTACQSGQAMRPLYLGRPAGSAALL